MSKIYSAEVVCPSCEAGNEYTRFTSLNAQRVKAQVERLLIGDFGRETCRTCGHSFEVEHQMLYSDWPRHLWVAVYPSIQRPHFVELEAKVRQPIERALASAPDKLAADAAGARIYLAFGWAKLAEIVRADAGGLDPALLECVKMTLVRDTPQLVRSGPVELLLTSVADERLQFSARGLATRGPGLSLQLPRERYAEVAEQAAAYRERFPELFTKPFVDATRYLVEPMAGTGS